MSIQTTEHIQREYAIARISWVCELVYRHDYKALEEFTFEPDGNLTEFVDNGIDFKPEFVGMWTSQMLEDVINKPFFRRTMFENYTVYD